MNHEAKAHPDAWLDSELLRELDHAIGDKVGPVTDKVEVTFGLLLQVRHRIRRNAPRNAPTPTDPLRLALELIDQHGCETFVFGRCLDEGSGRTRGAQYGADAWCAPCIARDALNADVRDVTAEHDLLCLPCASRAWSVPIEKLETTAVPGKVYECPVCGDKWRQPPEGRLT